VNGPTKTSNHHPSLECTEMLASGQLLGHPVTEFLRALCVNNASIAELHFRSYNPTPNLGERLNVGKVPSPWLSRAQDTASKAGVSLWEALAGMVIRDGAHLPRNVFVEALAHHHSDIEKTISVGRETILDANTDFFKDSIGAADGLAVCSGLRLRAGYTVHIPMLDFVCSPTPANRATISTMLEVIEQQGVIVNSGNSYHFFGLTFLTNDEWVRFMGQALLLAPFVDTRFIGHRLLDGECTLRVFARHKHPQIPVIESCVHVTERL
jgi:hypothetical protein